MTLAIAALKRLEIHEYGTISYLEPLMAALIGRFIYSESLSPGQALGCTLIFGAGLAQVFLARLP